MCNVVLREHILNVFHDSSLGHCVPLITSFLKNPSGRLHDRSYIPLTCKCSDYAHYPMSSVMLITSIIILEVIFMMIALILSISMHIYMQKKIVSTLT